MEQELSVIQQHFHDTTQAQLAERLGVTQSTISRLLRGKITPRGTTKKLISLLASEVNQCKYHSSH